MQDQILQTINRKLADAQYIVHEAGYSSSAIRMLYQLKINGPMRVTAIADAIHITQQAVGKTLTAMAVDGLVEPVTESSGVSDGRARPMGLTTKGTAALNSIAKVWK